MSKWIVLLITTQLAGFGAHAEARWAPELGAPGQNTSPDTTPRALRDPDHWIAIVGDSGVTGAASDPELSANVFTLLGRMGAIGLSQGVASALDVGAGTTNRILYSSRELREAADKGKTLELRTQALGAAAVDRVENAFGFTVARELGVNAGDVVVVGQDGKRVSSIPTQLERIYEVGTTTLPPLVLMSYTANDFCDLDVFEETVAQRQAAFEASLATAWERARPFLRAHPRGTDIVVLAPLEVANVLTNDDLLAQEIPLGVFGKVTCREMRESTFEDSMVANLIARKLTGMCPAVLGTRPGDTSRLQRLRDVQEAFNQTWKRRIAELNRAHAGEGLRWTYVEGTRAIEFGRGDVANECFHPSAQGHAKIAAEVMRALVKVEPKH